MVHCLHGEVSELQGSKATSRGDSRADRHIRRGGFRGGSNPLRANESPSHSPIPGSADGQGPDAQLVPLQTHDRLKHIR
jgi:hypothetical protein